jgi:TIR domain
MAHDVFISYSSKDKPVADATCATLESKGIRCWMAPRDIMPGSDWGESIVDAINGSRAFVLVFSGNANASVQIKREVERTVNKGIPIIPLRIENVMPAKSLEYFLSTPHWLDAFSPPLERHLNYLADVIRSVLEGQKPPPPPAPVKPFEGVDKRVLIGGAAAMLAVAAITVWSGLRMLAPPSFVGKWTAEKIETDPDASSPFGAFSISVFVKPVIQAQRMSGNFQVSDLGQYKADFGGDDSGTVRASGSSKLTFTSDISHQSTEFEYIIVNSATASSAVSSLGGQPGEGAIAITAPGTQQSMLVGKSGGAGLTGHWYTHTPANPAIGAVTTSLDVTPDGRYHYHFAIGESGVWQAADGKWTRSPQGMMPTSGTYKFNGADRVTCAASNGATVWKRVD